VAILPHEVKAVLGQFFQTWLVKVVTDIPVWHTWWW